MAWPRVRLGEVLNRSTETTMISPDSEYHEITVKLWGKGVVPRGVMSGAEIAGSRRFVAKTGQFILSRIDARNGATGIVPPMLDGAVVTNDFPLFNLNQLKLNAAFFGWLSKTHDFVELCKRASEGTTNRVRLQEDRFLNLEIPLPPLAEQRRVVARIEALAAKIAEARSLRHQAAEEAGKVMAAAERNIWPRESLDGAKTLESLTVFLARGRQSEQGESDHYLIKTQHVQQEHYIPTMLRLASHIASKVKTEAIARNGDILIACSAAGCLGRVARYSEDGRAASTDTHVAIVRSNPEVVDSDYLYAYLCGAQGQHQLRSRERGDWQREKIGFRLTELNLKDLKKVPVPLPDRAEQRRIVTELNVLRAEVDALTRLQAETTAELAPLLPAILDRAFKGEL